VFLYFTVNEKDKKKKTLEKNPHFISNHLNQKILDKYLMDTIWTEMSYLIANFIALILYSFKKMIKIL